MEWMILHTACAAVLVLVGAAAARGFPTGRVGRCGQKAAPIAPPEDEFARDLAAMLGYSGEEEEKQDEA